MEKLKEYAIGSSDLTYDLIERILNDGTHLVLSDEAIAKIKHCREYLDRKTDDNTVPIYGVTTGFGSLCNKHISTDELSELQENLVKSHSCSVGTPVDRTVVKLMLLLKAHALSKGFSGVQVETVQRILDFYNNDVLPVVYDRGSLGASGDLAPLANLFLPLIGEGMVEYQGKVIKGIEALNIMGWRPIRLKSKEGLALLNGTQFMSAHAVWAVLRARELNAVADKVAAMSLDAFDGRIEPFCAPVNEVRHHRGQIETAAAIRSLLEGSELIRRHKVHVQDPYSFRCVPQVHGAAKDALRFVSSVIEDEINAPTDNPTIFPDEDIIVSAGNFHGEPIAMPMDYLAVSLAELANISERRTYKLISGSRELPSFLVANPGLNSGFMIPQYTAASIVSQSKGLCMPASVDSIPSSQGQEDHVSMGSNAATKLLRVVDNTRRVLAIELMNAAQALEFRRPLRSSDAVEKLFEDYRKQVPFVDNDQVMYPHIAASVKFLDEYEIAD